MLEKIKSRKFIISVVSAVLVLLNQGLGYELPTETVLGFAGIVISYVLGQSYVDAQK